MIRPLLCSWFIIGLCFGQVHERDTLGLGEVEIEDLLEGNTAESGEAQIVDALEDANKRKSTVSFRTRLQMDRPVSTVRSPLGSPIKAYQRVLCRTEDFWSRSILEGGTVAEKDPGERVSDLFAAGYVR